MLDVVIDGLRCMHVSVECSVMDENRMVAKRSIEIRQVAVHNRWMHLYSDEDTFDVEAEGCISVDEYLGAMRGAYQKMKGLRFNNVTGHFEAPSARAATEGTAVHDKCCECSEPTMVRTMNCVENHPLCVRCWTRVTYDALAEKTKNARVATRAV